MKTMLTYNINAEKLADRAEKIIQITVYLKI